MGAKNRLWGKKPLSLPLLATLLLLGTFVLGGFSGMFVYATGSAVATETWMKMVSHTEYRYAEEGQIIARLVNYQGNPITVINCTADILYPDKTYFVDDGLMTTSSISGDHYYNFTTPNGPEGVYEYQATCFYTVGAQTRNRSVTNSFHLSGAFNRVLGNLTDISGNVTQLASDLDAVNSSLSGDIADLSTQLNANTSDVLAAIQDTNSTLYQAIVNTNSTLHQAIDELNFTALETQLNDTYNAVVALNTTVNDNFQVTTSYLSDINSTVTNISTEVQNNQDLLLTINTTTTNTYDYVTGTLATNVNSILSQLGVINATVNRIEVNTEAINSTVNTILSNQEDQVHMSVFSG